MEQREVTDLRSALELLKTMPGQYMETNVEADPYLEIAGVYRKIGAGGTLPQTVRNGPTVVFNNVKGYPGARVAIGVLGSRKRIGAYLGTPPERLGWDLRSSVTAPLPPVLLNKEPAPCQQVVHRADEPGFDVRKILPIIQTTAEDAGPCITMGLCRASDPETGANDVTIHRIFAQDQLDELTILADPKVGRHIGLMFQKAEQKGHSLPISISIGIDPIIYIASCFTAPTTPLGYDELAIAGALRGKPVDLVRCKTIDGTAIAHAEYVIEGEILPGKRVREDKLTGRGQGLNEFLSYTGIAHEVPIIKVKAITHRVDPIYQTCLGPSEEHVNMAGLPTEACIIDMLDRALPGQIVNVYASPAGGGKLMAIIQFRKLVSAHEGTQRQAALLAFSAFHELKHIILVDEDVNPFDSEDVLWALNSRYQADVDTICLPGVAGHHIDPSAWPIYNPNLRVPGNTCKAIFDCTVPFDQKERFARAQLGEYDLAKFFPSGM
ncbi:MAG: UbiD family decarboxylase [Oscillospiraceae bacterium]|nr:UbiD family decarboxylase [Oscillospiraceae bacterium]